MDEAHLSRAKRMVRSAEIDEIITAGAHALIAIAEQGEVRIDLEKERNELHRRSVESGEKAAEEHKEIANEMIELSRPMVPIATAVDARNRDFDQGYETGRRFERERIDRNRATGFSRGFEAGKALYQPVGEATKELIDAVLEWEAHAANRYSHGGGCFTTHYHRLRRAVEAYRELMSKELRS